MPEFVEYTHTYRWSTKEILELIEMIKEQPSLWNVNTAEYKSRAKKDAAMKMLAKHFDVSVDLLKTKMHSLRTQYTHERKKIKRREAQTGLPGTPFWQYYDKLSFMFNQQPECGDSDDSRSSTIWLQENTYNDDETEDGTDPLSIRKRSPTPQHSIVSTSDSVFKPKKIKNGPTDAVANDSAFSDEENRKDEYTVFGEYVASELRTLRNQKYVQCNLKNAILNSIIEANKAANK